MPLQLQEGAQLEGDHLDHLENQQLKRSLTKQPSQQQTQVSTIIQPCLIPSHSPQSPVSPLSPSLGAAETPHNHYRRLTCLSGHFPTQFCELIPLKTKSHPFDKRQWFCREGLGSKQRVKWASPPAGVQE